MAEFATKLVSYSENRADGGFNWPVKYDLAFQSGEFYSQLRVRLVNDPGEALTSIWENGVERIWNEKVFFSDGTRLYPVELDIEFVTSGEHQVVTVHHTVGRANMANWYTIPEGWGTAFHDEIAAHEAGHMWGNFDEYFGGATFGGFTTTGRLMADNTPVVYDYYYFSLEHYAQTYSGTPISTVYAIRGSSAGTVMNGTSAMNGIYALGGNDEVDGKGGNDYIDGGSGDDFLEGGSGNDILVGGNGNDVFDWSSDSRAGADVMNGGAGNDVYVIDESNTDVIIDSSGRDRIWSPFSYSIETRSEIEELGLFGSAALTATGNTGNNRLLGNSESNVLSGLDGNDTITGGGGSDLLLGGAGNDKLNGESGSDTASYAGMSAGVIVKLSSTKAQDTGGGGIDTLKAIERVIGSDHDDELHGSSGNNVLSGGAGNDLLRGLAGNDKLNGDAGTDTASYAGASSAVTVKLSVLTGQKTGGAGTDTLSQIENLVGSKYNDRLYGDNGANGLDGSSGNDQLRGGLGNDILTGGAGKDRFYFDSALGATNVDTIVDFTPGSDRIYLDDDIFTALGVVTAARALGALNLSVTGSAVDADDFIVYDPTTGALYYDADGDGAGAAVQFALLGTGTHPAISAADIFVTA